MPAETVPVTARFSEAAHRYEQAALVQKQAALLFDQWLARQATFTPDRIAEIGCGTGLFTRLLRKRYPRALIHATDLAPAMVDRCRDNLRHAPGLQFSVCDGRNVDFDPAPDWIVSTMCFQWLEPLQPVLERHCAASRVLAFSVMLDSSFSEWRAAHQRLGIAPGLHACPDYDRLLRTCESLGARRVHAHRVTLSEHHATGMSFAGSLRAIGADQPRSGHRPVNLRAVFRQLEQGLSANYDIGFFYIET